MVFQDVCLSSSVLALSTSWMWRRFPFTLEQLQNIIIHSESCAVCIPPWWESMCICCVSVCSLCPCTFFKNRVTLAPFCVCVCHWYVGIFVWFSAAWCVFYTVAIGQQETLWGGMSQCSDISVQTDNKAAKACLLACPLHPLLAPLLFVCVFSPAVIISRILLSLHALHYLGLSVHTILLPHNFCFATVSIFALSTNFFITDDTDWLVLALTCVLCDFWQHYNCLTPNSDCACNDIGVRVFNVQFLHNFCLKDKAGNHAIA